MVRFDPYDNALVIDGWENGVADSPYTGVSNLQSVNIVSVPGEASVNFATSSIVSPSVSANVTSVSSNIVTVDVPGSLETGMSISFSNVASYTGITTGTPFWVQKITTNTFKIYSDELNSTQVVITGSGTAPFTAYTMGQPKYFSSGISNNFLLDSNGRVWSDRLTTTSGYWTFTGNSVSNSGNNQGIGNGMVYYVAYDSSGQGGTLSTTGYLFIFRNSQIDYVQDVSAFTWVYGWNPADGSTGNSTGYLKTAPGTTNEHDAFVAPDNKVYFCDSFWIGRFYQVNPSTKFVPTATSTYIFDQTALLPGTEIANRITYLGNNILVGSNSNKIYVWDTFDTTWSSVILLPELNVSRMVTVNTNTYIFAGVRGRIYITNGFQAQLYKKIPDHISSTVEPYFTWGGATFQKNQLYFGVSATTNAGSALTSYAGVWAINTDNGALRMSNQLSNSSAYASSILALSGTQPGASLIVGWTDGTNTGADKSTSGPYTGSQAFVESDLIPIGTYTRPRNTCQIEYKLTKPLVSGESISIYYRTDMSQSYTLIWTDSTVGSYSGFKASAFKNAQWLQLKAVLNSTASSPSYVRLKELRITGISGTQ